MALVLHTLMEIMRKPTVCGLISELAFFATPVWVAVFVGVVVGWAWRPRWADGLVWGGKESFDDEIQVKNSNDLGVLRFDWIRAQLRSYLTYLIPEQDSEKEMGVDLGCSSQEEGKLAVSFEDLKNLLALVETTDGGPAWIHMMDRSLPSMSYQAWRRDFERGPPQYRSRTIFDDARPETVRNFFWDDEFRMKNKWDDMLLYHEVLEECPVTGTMVVHWVRKFPFFCSDREYTIGRRIWEVDGAYYCVTKGVPFPSIPRQKKPRRVDLYYSSWCIRAAESSRGDGHTSACEVLLFHYEDMGIPHEIAKLGVRQGMWGCVKKIEPGLRAYQAARKSGEPLSHCAIMAQINTKVTSGQVRSPEDRRVESDFLAGGEEKEKKKNWGSNLLKIVLVGGALGLACTVDRGLITKAVIFGVVRRFGKIGRRL